MNHHHHQNHPPSSLPSNPNPEPDPSLPCNGYHKISLPLLRRCMSDPCNPPSDTAANPSFFDPSLSSASTCGGSLPNFTPPYSPDRHHCPKTPSHSPTHALPPLPPPHTFRRSVSDINPSPAKASSRFSTSSQDLGTDIDTPNSKRLRRMKDRLREMSHWCQQLMREEDLMEEDEDEQQQAVEEEAQVQAVDAADQDFHSNTGAAEDECEKEFAESVSVEKKDDCLVIHFSCHCDKAYQFLLSGGECYYKLM
ncbi:unnamed protein product [Prunus armeniaca]